MEGLKAKWQELQPRERMLLMLMGGVFVFLGLFMVVVTIMGSFDESRAEIDQYREALYYLEDNQAEFNANKKRSEELRERLIQGSDIGVASFLSKTASDLGFDVSVDPKKEAPASTTDTTGTVQQEIQVTIRAVDRDQLLDYLWAINQSQAPLFIQRLQINRSRATGTTGGNDTQLSASVTVVAYRLDASGGGSDDF